MKVVSVVFGGGVSTLGMEVVLNSIQDPCIEVERFSGRVSQARNG